FGLPYGVSNTRGRILPEAVRAITAEAWDAGIRVWDTAAAYGEAESVLGSVLSPATYFRIVSKSLPVSQGLAAVEKGVRRSISLLGGRPLDTVLVHSAGDLAGPEGRTLWRMLQSLREEGLFGRVGISAYVADEPVKLAEQFSPAVMQVPVS